MYDGKYGKKLGFDIIEDPTKNSAECLIISYVHKLSYYNFPCFLPYSFLVLQVIKLYVEADI
jgi:hypothetical protein